MGARLGKGYQLKKLEELEREIAEVMMYVKDQYGMDHCISPLSAMCCALDKEKEKFAELSLKNYELIAEKDRAWSDGYDTLEDEIAGALGLCDNDVTPIVNHIKAMMRGKKLIQEENKKLRVEKYQRMSEIQEKPDMMTANLDNAMARIKDLSERYKHQSELADSRYKTIQQLEKEFKVLHSMIETTAYEVKQSYEKLGIK